MAGRISAFKKFVIIALGLIVFEVLYIFFFGAAGPSKDPQEVIRDALSKVQSGGLERQVQVAVQLYRVQNDGKLPDSLAQLVPKYLSTQPIDPVTNKPLAYRVEGDKFYVGAGGTNVAMVKDGSKTIVSVDQATAQEMTAQVFLKALSEPPNAKLAHFDATNRRDPFRPFDLSARTSLDIARTPLQGVDVTELSLTAVVEQGGDARAVIEMPNGQGYAVRKGDKVGLNAGEVVEIYPDKILVLESSQDFTGDIKTKTVEILRKGQKKEAPGSRRKGVAGRS